MKATSPPAGIMARCPPTASIISMPVLWTAMSPMRIPVPTLR